jgi:outer membrane protein assembly factor BamB
MLPVSVPTRLWESPLDLYPVSDDGPDRTLLATTFGTNPDPAQLYGVNTDDGSVRWHLPASTWPDSFEDVGQADPGTEILSTGNPGDGVTIQALHIADGSIRQWSIRDASVPQLAVAGRDVLIAFDARTVLFDPAGGGRVVWQRTAGPGCSLGRSGADAAIGVTDATCGGVRRITAYDIATGTTLWSKDLATASVEDGADVDDLSVSGDLVAVENLGVLTVYDRRGRTVTDVTTGGSVECVATCVEQAGDVALLNYFVRDRPTVFAVDIATGRALWHSDEFALPAVIVGGYAYSVSDSDVETTVSSTVNVTDVVTGRTVKTATLVENVPPSLLVPDRHLLFMSARGGGSADSNLVAMRLSTDGAGPFGGAPAARWPDPCALLTPDDLHAAMPRYTYHEISPPPVPSPTAPAAIRTECAYGADPVTGPTVTVQVLWSATSAAQAADAMSALATRNSFVFAVAGIGDAATGTYDYPDTGEITLIAVRVGTVVFQVKVGAGASVARTLALDAAARLHD